MVLLLGALCWQCAAAQKTETNQVQSEWPGGTVEMVQQDAPDYTFDTIGTTGLGELYATNLSATTDNPGGTMGTVETTEPNDNVPIGDSTDPPIKQKGFWELVGGYWAELVLGIMAVIKILVRITPTLKDDAVFGWLDKLIEMIIPNISKKNG